MTDHKEKFEEFRNNEAINWIILKANIQNNEPKFDFDGSGKGGLEELETKFNEDFCFFSLLKSQNKVFFIKYFGKNVKSFYLIKINKMTSKNSEIVQNYFIPNDQVIEPLNVSEISFLIEGKVLKVKEVLKHEKEAIVKAKSKLPVHKDALGVSLNEKNLVSKLESKLFKEKSIIQNSVELQDEVEGLPVLKEMLTTNYNFKKMEKIESLDQINENVKREDLKLPNARTFLLHDLLTSQECDEIISQAEKLEFSTLADLFPKDYRDHDRLIVISHEIANSLFKRIEKHLTKDDLLRIRPIGFGNQGLWKPVRFNEAIKISKSQKKNFFAPHLDGPWIPRNEESSIYTMLIYLNDDFKGGKTTFLKNGSKKQTVSIEPKKGTALLFTHDSLHEGDPVEEGTKYLLRTELIFERVDKENHLDTQYFLKDENYLKALTLYQKSLQMEYKDPKEFKNTYFEHLEIMVKHQKSVDEYYIDKLNKQFLPYDCLVQVFQFIKPVHLFHCLTVNKEWFDTIRDGDIWKKNLEDLEKTKYESSSLTKDWFGLYKQKLALNLSQPLVIDLGSHTVKYAALLKKKKEVQTLIVENYVMRHSRAWHLRTYDYNGNWIGESAKNFFGKSKQEMPDYWEGMSPPDEVVVERAIENGIARLNLLPEIFCYAFFKLGFSPKKSHVLLIEPFPGWNNDAKESLSSMLFNIFHVQFVGFVHPAILALKNQGLVTGTVISLGDAVGAIVPVFQGKVDYQLMKSIKVVSSAEEIEKTLNEMYGNLSLTMKSAYSTIVLTGHLSFDVEESLTTLLQDKYLIIKPKERHLDLVLGGIEFQKQIPKKDPFWIYPNEMKYSKDIFERIAKEKGTGHLRHFYDKFNYGKYDFYSQQIEKNVSKSEMLNNL